jgi:hypothetical protein
MSKSKTLRWALVGSTLMFGLGLGSCNLSSLGSLAPLAILAALTGTSFGGGNDTAS